MILDAMNSQSQEQGQRNRKFRPSGRRSGPRRGRGGGPHRSSRSTEGQLGPMPEQTKDRMDYWLAHLRTPLTEAGLNDEEIERVIIDNRYNKTLIEEACNEIFDRLCDGEWKVADRRTRNAPPAPAIPTTAGQSLSHAGGKRGRSNNASKGPNNNRNRTNTTAKRDSRLKTKDNSIIDSSTTATKPEEEEPVEEGSLPQVTWADRMRLKEAERVQNQPQKKKGGSPKHQAEASDFNQNNDELVLAQSPIVEIDREEQFPNHFDTADDHGREAHYLRGSDDHVVHQQQAVIESLHAEPQLFDTTPVPAGLCGLADIAPPASIPDVDASPSGDFPVSPTKSLGGPVPTLRPSFGPESFSVPMTGFPASPGAQPMMPPGVYPHHIPPQMGWFPPAGGTYAPMGGPIPGMHGTRAPMGAFPMGAMPFLSPGGEPSQTNEVHSNGDEHNPSTEETQADTSPMAPGPMVFIPQMANQPMHSYYCHPSPPYGSYPVGHVPQTEPGPFVPFLQTNQTAGPHSVAPGANVEGSTETNANQQTATAVPTMMTVHPQFPPQFVSSSVYPGMAPFYPYHYYPTPEASQNVEGTRNGDLV